MRASIYLLVTVAVLASLFAACAAPAAPTAAPTKPAAAPAGATTPAASGAATSATAAPAGATAAATKPAAKIKRGGTLTSIQMRPYPTMDPHESSTSMPAFYLIFDGLMSYERDAKTGEWSVKPELAESWTMPDPKTLVFKLRQGVKYHDGSPFNAEAAKWNINRWITDDKYYQKVYVETIAGVDVVDDSTIKVNLKVPSASTLVLLARSTEQGGFSFMSKDAFEKQGYDKMQATAVGTGAMEMEQFLRDDRVVLKRNANYWKMGEDGQPLPYLDKYIERTILDPAVALLEVRSGNAQIMVDADPKDVAAVKSNPDLVYDEMSWGATFHFHTVFSFAGPGPLSKELKVRQAAQYAIDREGMAKTLGFGIGSAHYFPWFGPGMLGYDDKNPHYDYQPEKAQQLLKEAGYPNGVDIVYSVIARQPEQRISEIAQSMWNKVGIRTTIDQMDRLVWNAKMRDQKYDAGLYRGSAYPDSDLTRRAFMSDAGSNFSGAKIPALDKCITDANAEYDRAKRHELYKTCQKVVFENAYHATGYMMPGNYVYRKNIKGVTFNWIMPDFRKVWIDN